MFPDDLSLPERGLKRNTAMVAVSSGRRENVRTKEHKMAQHGKHIAIYGKGGIGKSTTTSNNRAAPGA
ncbi:hypothetical protein, partial [Treponema endosymbiont of Eucomonympha sp.]|uniref:hypothetical protein n=1 Tax=Treponema endosymbiont of Eucomonympha sp. TaxID=1580831 RepID=UPI001EE72685